MNNITASSTVFPLNLSPQWATAHRVLRALAVGATLIVAGCSDGNNENDDDNQQVAACSGKVYSSDSSGGAVVVIDSQTNEVITTIPVGDGAINPTITPDGSQIYVSAHNEAGVISIIDAKTNTVVDTLSAGPGPSGLAFTPDGKKLVVSLFGYPAREDSFLRVIELESGDMSAPIPIAIGSERVALSPDGNTAYTGSLQSNVIDVVDLVNEVVVGQIILDSGPFNLLVSPSGDRLYAGMVLSTYVAVINTTTNTLVGRIDSPSPNGIAFSPDYESIYVTNIFNNTVQQISLSEGEFGAVVNTMPTASGGGFMRVTPEGDRAYFSLPYDTGVSVIDTETLEEIDLIDAGPSTSLAVCGAP